MAVNVTSSGGIYIEISGNYSQFEADLRAVRQLARTAGAELSKSLGVPIDHKPINDLTQSMMKAQAASKAMAVDLKSQESAIREWGQAVGITGKQLDSYVALQGKAFQTQAAKTFTSELRNIQRQTGATDEEIRALAKSLGGTGEEFSNAVKGGQSFGDCIKGLGLQAAAASAAFLAVKKVVGAVFDFVGSGLDYNKQLENAQIGISTILSLNNKIYDSQGKMLQGQEKFNAAQVISVDIVKQLDAATVNFMGDFNQLMSGFQSSLGQAASKGIGWQKTIDMVTLMGNTMKAANLDLDTLDKEMKRFLTGKDLDNSQVLKVLSGISKETVKAWGTGEEYVRNFNKALEDSVYAGQAAQKSYAVSISSVRENVQSLAAEMTKPLFDKISESAYGFADALFVIDKTTKTWTVREDIQPLVDVGKELATALGVGLSVAVKQFTSALRVIGGVVAAIQDSWKNLWTNMEKVGLEDLENSLNESSLGEETLRPLRESLEKAKAKVKETENQARESGEKITESFTTAGNAVDNFGEDAKKAAKEIDALEKKVAALYQKASESLPLDQQEQRIWAEYEKDMKAALATANKRKRDLLEEQATLEASLKLEKLITEEEKNQKKAADEKKKADEKGQQHIRERLEFYQRLAELSGDYGLAIEHQNRLIEEQVKDWKKIGIERDEDIKKMKELLKLQISRDPADGARRAYIKYMAEATDQAKQMEKVYSDLFTGIDSGMKSMWEDFVDDGKVSMSSLKNTFKKFLSDLAYMAIMQPITLQLTGSIASSMGITGGGGNILTSLLGLSSAASCSTGNSGGFSVANLPVSQLIPDSVKSTVGGWLGMSGTNSTAYYAGYNSMFSSAYNDAIQAGMTESIAYELADTVAKEAATSAASSTGGSWASGLANVGYGVVGSLAGSYASPYVNDWLGVQNNKGAQTGVQVGATTGAVVGTYIFPGIGTAIGAALGAIIGGVAGGIAGKERQSYVYGAMRTNLVDPAAYGSELELRENSQALADAFGDTARNLSGDWNAIDLKGTTGHSAYYIDPVHAGGQSHKIASALEPAMLEMETMVMEIASTIRDSLPTDELKKNLDAYNMENALVLEYKTKGGNLNEQGLEHWANTWAEMTQDHLLKALNTLDWSEYEGKLKVDTSTWEGYEMFLAGLNAIEDVKTATKELTDPTSEWVTQAKAANAQLDEWAYSLRQYGVEAEYATQLMDEYRAASVGEYVKALQDAVTPASQLSQAMKALEDDMNGRIEGLKILGATEAQVARATVVMNQALADLKASMSEPFYNDLRVRALTVAGGDVAGEQLRQNHVAQRVSAIATFGEDSTEYANLLAVQQAEAMKHQADMAQAEYERLAASLNSLAQTAGQAASSVESARLALVTELVNAELTARNGIKEAVDAWADAAKSAFDSAANTYASALQSSTNAFSSLAEKLRQAQTSLWTDASASPSTAYGAAKAEAERLYALGMSGDSNAADSFINAQKTLLDTGRSTLGSYEEYQDDFYNMQVMLRQLEAQAETQAEAGRTELEVLQNQYGIEVKSEKSLAAMKEDMEAARAVLDRTLEEQTAAYERWGFEAVVPGIEGLEIAYREAVDAWIAADAALNDALLTGLTTQMEIDSLRISSQIDTLTQAYRDAQAASAAAAAEYASASYQSMTALEQARQEAARLAQQALDLAAKAQSQIAATGGYAGSKYASEHELLQAKAASLNRGEYLPEDAGNITTWTVTNLKDYILNVAKMSVPEWFERHGKLEGFAAGGVATPGWAMVGEHGRELVHFSRRATVFPHKETERLLGHFSSSAPADAQFIAPSAPSGSAFGGSSPAAEMDNRNFILAALLEAADAIARNTREGKEFLETLAEGTSAAQPSLRREAFGGA